MPKNNGSIHKAFNPQVILFISRTRQTGFLKEVIIIKTTWILCPICNNKTRLRIRNDTEIKNFPLYCPKCKKETLIDVRVSKISIVTEPDAKTQSR